MLTITGIGVDDVFVFHDQWINAGNIEVLKNDIDKRFAYTFSKAKGSILLTSATTALAFLATSLTPMMPFVSFGIFASLIVMVNCGMALTILPTTYLIYYKHIVKTKIADSQNENEF